MASGTRTHPPSGFHSARASALCWVLAWAAVLTAPVTAQADTVIVAAASDLKFAMDEILEQFGEHHPDGRIDVVYGSSGKFSTQIAQGAPYDLYFSADIAYPRALAKRGFAASDVMPYAVGRIVLWSASLDARELRLEDLPGEDIRRIAIANPQHAPYGARAKEALEAAGVWGAVEGKLVLGSNISQAAQFVETGNADVGILALSLALSPRLSAVGRYWLIPDSMHNALEQGYIVTRRGADKALVWQFVEFMGSDQVQAIMTRYGLRD